MTFNPLTILGTLLGGLILAGLLGWIRKPRLVAFVPKLFSHSRISESGQIVEIWIMNRGFKNEEQIEVTFNPHLRYEIIGSNNPNLSLEKDKLLIPRIGAGDDSSVLLQVEGGKFTQEDIVSCLSKETKGSTTSKLEEVPITSSQRVGLLVFVIVFGTVLSLAFKGIDWYFDNKSSIGDESSAQGNISGLQDWKIRKIYADSSLWKLIEQSKILISVGDPTLIKQKATVTLTIQNNSAEIVNVTMSISASSDQNSIAYEDKRLTDKLLMPGQKVTHKFVANVDRDDANPAVLLDLFLETTDGETLNAKRLVSIK